MILSLFLFLLSSVLIIGLINRTQKNWLFYIYFLVYIVWTLLFIGYVFINHITGEGLNYATIYHLRMGQLTHAGLSTYTTQFIIGGSLYLLFIAILLLIKKYARVTPSRGFLFTIVASILFGMSVYIHPLYADIQQIHTFIAPTEAPSIETNVVHAVSAQPKFQDYYHRPEVTTNSHQKHLVIIYLEGIEQTFSNEQLFPGLTPHLHSYGQAYLSFDGVQQIEGTGFTIAGIVASQCGIPLISSTDVNTYGGMKNNFLSQAYCLGDFLSDQGYQTYFFGGADTSFAGKKYFLQNHGYQHIIGSTELQTLAPQGTPTHGWGYFDDVMFDTFLAEWQSLTPESPPHFFSLLTLDTHPPGITSPRCRQSGIDIADPMLRAIHCTDTLVNSVITDILQSPAGKDTTIVLVSDHLMMQSSVTKKIKDEVRRNRFTIIDTQTQGVGLLPTSGSVLDIASTILPLIGFEGNIGLGRSLLEEKNTLEEINQIQRLLPNWRYDIMDLWGNLSIADGVHIMNDSHTLLIGEATYALPALISYDTAKNYAARMVFRSDNQPDQLIKKAIELATGFKQTLVIDRCDVFNTQYPILSSTTVYCFGVGVQGHIVYIAPLTDGVELTPDMLQNIVTSHPNEFPKRIHCSAPASRESILQPHQDHTQTLQIAHTLGVTPAGDTGTNTKEAFEHTYAAGFRLFEADFMETKDHEILVAHERHEEFWNVPTLFEETDSTELKNKSYKGVYTPLFLDDLLQLLNTYPDASLIVDIKYADTEQYNRIMNRIITRSIAILGAAETFERIIPQIYTLDHIETLPILCSFSDLLFTQYRSSYQWSEVLSWLQQYPRVTAVATQYPNRYRDSYIHDLSSVQRGLYVHPITDTTTKKQMLDLGIGVFTSVIE